MPFFREAKYVSINGGQFTDVGGDWNQWDYSRHVHHENSHNNYAATATNSNNDTSFRGFSTLNTRHQQAPSMSHPSHTVQPNSAEEAAMIMNHVNNVLGRKFNALHPQHRPSPVAGREGESSRGRPQDSSQRQISPSQRVKSSSVSMYVRDPDISHFEPNSSFPPHLMKTNHELPRFPIPHSQDDVDVDSDDSQSDTSS